MASIAEGETGKVKAEPVPAPVQPARTVRYPLSMRILHWLMAAIIIVLLVAGITMVRLNDQVPAKFQVLFPWHKSFGLLALILAMCRGLLRRIVAMVRRSLLPTLHNRGQWDLTSNIISSIAD